MSDLPAPDNNLTSESTPVSTNNYDIYVNELQHWNFIVSDSLTLHLAFTLLLVDNVYS